jgi:hypothetical protein
MNRLRSTTIKLLFMVDPETCPNFSFDLGKIRYNKFYIIYYLYIIYDSVRKLCNTNKSFFFFLSSYPAPTLDISAIRRRAAQ